MLTGCVVWKSDFDKLQSQLQQQLVASQQEVSGLQGAIDYTVNSNLLVAPGAGKCAPRSSKLSPTWKTGADTADLLVGGYTVNAPIGEAPLQTVPTNKEMDS
jgi:chemotaxis protein MotB